MAKKPKERGISAELESAIGELLKQIMSDPTATLLDKTRIIDRAIKLEALKLKEDTDQWGAGFLDGKDDE